MNGKSTSRPQFVPFDEHFATKIYQRNLPHWRQAGATYFVTFRLADAIPPAAAAELESRRLAWLRARGIRDTKTQWKQLSLRDRFVYRKYVNRLREGIADAGHGMCALAKSDVLSIVRDELFKNDETLYHMGDFVVMPNHVHALLIPAQVELEQGLKRIKGASAVACNRILGQQGNFWQPDSYDHIVRSLIQLSAYRKYIAENPTKAGVRILSNAIYRASWMDEWYA